MVITRTVGEVNDDSRKEFGRCVLKKKKNKSRVIGGVDDESYSAPTLAKMT
jgi:hypothetical protein